MSLKSFFSALKKPKESNRAMETIGAKARVTVRIDNAGGCGSVMVKDTEWSARNVSDDDVSEAGETVLVVAVEGVRLICRRVK